MTRIDENTFAAACYDQNSIIDLEKALADGPDQTDMLTWALTADEWRQGIELAIATLREDGANDA